MMNNKWNEVFFNEVLFSENNKKISLEIREGFKNSSKYFEPFHVKSVNNILLSIT